MLSGKFAVVKSRSNSNPTFPVVPRVPGVALTLNPRLRALGLKPSAFNLSGWIPPQPITAANNRITAKVMPTNRGKAAKLTV